MVTPTEHVRCGVMLVLLIPWVFTTMHTRDTPRGSKQDDTFWERQG